MQGDVVFFDQWLVDVAKKLHDHSADVYKAAITDGTTTPSATTSDPRWGVGGGTNFATEEVTPGGNYVAGGATMANPTVTLAGGLAQIDTDDPATWAQDPSNPTNANWIIIYNNTDAGKRAVGYIDIGGAFDITSGPLSAQLGAPLATLNQA